MFVAWMGTVLGPLLFIFYININAIVTCIKHCKLTIFADDCVLYQSGNLWNNIQDMLQSDLNNFVSWSMDYLSISTTSNV